MNKTNKIGVENSEADLKIGSKELSYKQTCMIIIIYRIFNIILGCLFSGVI